MWCAGMDSLASPRRGDRSHSTFDPAAREAAAGALRIEIQRVWAMHLAVRRYDRLRIVRGVVAIGDSPSSLAFQPLLLPFGFAPRFAVKIAIEQQHPGADDAARHRRLGGFSSNGDRRPNGGEKGDDAKHD